MPTSDTVKYNFMIEKLTTGGHNVLITGETGVGKSVVARDYLMKAPATGSCYYRLSMLPSLTSQEKLQPKISLMPLKPS